MDTVIAEVADRGDADFVVLQATDQAVPFYERLGFSKVRVSASHVGAFTSIRIVSRND